MTAGNGVAPDHLDVHFKQDRSVFEAFGRNLAAFGARPTAVYRRFEEAAISEPALLFRLMAIRAQAGRQRKPGPRVNVHFTQDPRIHGDFETLLKKFGIPVVNAFRALQEAVLADPAILVTLMCGSATAGGAPRAQLPQPANASTITPPGGRRSRVKAARAKN